MKPLRVRKCKAIHDDIKCGITYIPAEPWALWCSDSCRAALKLAEYEKKLEQAKRANKKKINQEAKEKRQAHAKRKQEVRLLSWFHNKARVACNSYIRRRDRNDCCISCDKPLAFEDKYDAGHWKTQGAHKWIAYDEVNVNGQCTECNCYKDGNEAAQRPRLVAKWGIDEVERLEQSGKNLGNKSYTRDDLLEIEKHYKAKLKELQLNCE